MKQTNVVDREAVRELILFAKNSKAAAIIRAAQNLSNRAA